MTQTALPGRGLAIVVLAATAGCATAEPAIAPVVEAVPAPPQAQVVPGTLVIGGREVAVDWFVPTAAPARALVTVQHGFARQCANVRETGLELAAQGLLGLCLNAGMAGGNPALADALAAALVAGVNGPDGQPVPERVIVGGHSAGGHFASRLGWALAGSVPQRLAGAVLWDPVAANADFRTQLMAVSASGQRPVYAVLANPDGCNANGNALPALRQLRQDAIGAGGDGFVGLQLTDRSTHVDVEGRDSNLLATVPCGVPRRANSDALRTLSVRWAADIADGARTRDAYPGGPYVDGLVDAARAQPVQ